MPNVRPLIRWAFVSLLYLSTSHLCLGEEETTTDRCSWTESGAIADAGVRVVQLSCFEGRLLWKYPSGALSVWLSPPPTGPTSTSWQFCVRLIKNDPTVSFFRQNGSALVPLASGLRDEFCFDTVSQLSLYIQKESVGSVIKSWVGFYYSARPTDQANPAQADLGQAASQEDRCRPCSPAQLTQAFCSAELVFKGRPMDKMPPAEPMRELKFMVQSLLRRPADHKDVLSKFRRKGHKWTGNVYMWSDCTIEMAPGDQDLYLVMARMHLGRAKVLCAPLWSDFETIRASQNSPVCQLS